MKNIANCGYFLPKHGNFTSFRPPVRHHFLCRFDKKKSILAIQNIEGDAQNLPLG